MEHNQQSLKNAAIVALSAMGLLLVGAIVFYRERIFFSDAAFIVFNSITYKGPYIQSGRWGSFITQLAPWFGQKMHMPLKAILIGYSAGFNLFYCSVAALLIFRYRQYKLAILMALYYFLLVTDSYFWTNSEIHQAVAWMFLFTGVIVWLADRKVSNVRFVLTFLVLAYLTVITHFVVIIPLTFLWVYLWLDQANWPFSHRKTILMGSMILAVVITKYLLTDSNSYDGSHLRGLTHCSIQDIITTPLTSVVKMFVYHSITLYWPAFIIFAWGLWVLERSGKRRLVLWSLISCAGYFVIMGLSYRDLDRNVLLFHIESEWASLAIILATPFVFAVLPELKQKVGINVLAAIFAIRLIYIVSAAPAFSWRIDFQQRILVQMRKKNCTKLALLQTPEISKKYMLDWATSFESLLNSSAANDEPQLMFRMVNPTDTPLLTMMKDPRNICMFEHVINYQYQLNSTYFRVDTTRAYQVMTYDELFK